MPKQIPFFQNKHRVPSPFFYDSDWDYYDALEEAHRKHWNSAPRIREEDMEEDMDIEVNQRGE